HIRNGGSQNAGSLVLNDRNRGSKYSGLFTMAQELSDKIRVEDLHQVLDIIAQRYCPVIKTYHLTYCWSIMQAECATDIVFKRQSDLKLLYAPLIRIAIHSVKPEHITTICFRVKSSSINKRFFVG
ncbi:MAG: hypothetical protein JXA46_05995, partial [Dehalococcoidales bacterium]|nr:hypothetical protein [Dehalococcoidales bacterium]